MMIDIFMVFGRENIDNSVFIQNEFFKAKLKVSLKQ